MPPIPPMPLPAPALLLVPANPPLAFEEPAWATEPLGVAASVQATQPTSTSVRAANDASRSPWFARLRLFGFGERVTT
ncbi:MAG: hypothetical protein ABUL60_32770 [Myxococcales bacterium]